MRSQNLDIVNIDLLNSRRTPPGDPIVPHKKLITFVTTARDTIAAMPWTHAKSKANSDGGLEKHSRPESARPFSGILQHDAWVKEVTSGSYRQWIATQYS